MARHAEVKDERVAAVGVDETVLRPAAEAGHDRAGQPLTEVDRKRAAQIRTPRFDRVQPPPVQDLRKPADGGFDFGKLRHGRDMAEVGQAR
jgi:hypothetical protein